jgi:hypothetical protein
MSNSFLSSQLPQQMVSILESTLLQHVFSLWSDRSASLRFISWLQHALGNGKLYYKTYLICVSIHPLSSELDSYTPGAPETPFLSNLLKCLYNLTSFLLVSRTPSPPCPAPTNFSQEPIPTVEHFLSLLLETWNGDDYQSEVLALLTHISLQPFEGKHQLTSYMHYSSASSRQ